MTSGITWIFSLFPFPVYVAVTISMSNATKLRVVQRKWKQEWKTETETCKFFVIYQTLTSEVHRIQCIRKHSHQYAIIVRLFLLHRTLSVKHLCKNSLLTGVIHDLLYTVLLSSLFNTHHMSILIHRCFNISMGLNNASFQYRRL